MARFTLPRDLYHGKGSLAVLKDLKGSRAMVCVGGGIGNEKENLLAPTRKLIVSERYTVHSKKQTQLVAAVLGNDAGIIGAALLDE